MPFRGLANATTGLLCVSLLAGTASAQRPLVQVDGTYDLTLQRDLDGYAGVIDAGFSNALTDQNDNGATFRIDPNGDRRAVLHFDLSVLPEGATLTSAWLRLTPTAQGEEGNVSAYPLTAAFEEETVTWQSWQNPGGDFADTPAGTYFDGTNPLDIELTAFAQGWVADPGSNLGVLLTSDVATEFASSEGTQGVRPTLTLSFTIEGNAPAFTGVHAFHRSGQTFVLFGERMDLQGEHYRVYRSNSPIEDAADLANATMLYELPENTGAFFLDRHFPLTTRQWRTRYFERYVVAEGAGELHESTGMLVWTLDEGELGADRQGEGYYAVVVVPQGGEPEIDTLGGPWATGPVAETVDDPLPVVGIKTEGGRAYIQYMDLKNWNPTYNAPREGSFWGRSSDTPGIQEAIQYAYPYIVLDPRVDACPGRQLPEQAPLLVNLHGHTGGDQPADVPLVASRYYCVLEMRPADFNNSWYLGFARDHDYRTGEGPSGDDVVVNYTEQRLLRMVYDLLRMPGDRPPPDPNRLYIYGHSMGGSGAMAMGIRYPEVFAAFYSSQGQTNYAANERWRPNAEYRWGRRRDEYPVIFRGVGPWTQFADRFSGRLVWDMQDHRTHMLTHLGDDVAPFGIAHGYNDRSITWRDVGQPSYVDFDASKVTWGGLINGFDHRWEGWRGMPEPLSVDRSSAPFNGFTVVKNESIPAFERTSGNSPYPPPSGVDSFYNQVVTWSSSWLDWAGPPVDEPARWSMAFRTEDDTEQTVGITPRRLQQFQVVPRRRYRWTLTDLEGNAISEGTVLPDAHNLLTVHAVPVGPDGVRLTLVPDCAGDDPAQCTSVDGQVHPEAQVSPEARVLSRAAIGPRAVVGAATTIDGTVGSDSAVGAGSRIASYSAIGPGATVGERVEVGPEAKVGPRVRLGDDSILVQRRRIGADCQIGANSMISADLPEGVYLGQRARIYHQAQIASTVWAGGYLEVAEEVVIGARTTIGERVRIDRTALVAEDVWIGDDVWIGTDAVIGAGAVIGPNVEIADGEVVDPGAVVIFVPEEDDEP
ncbi:MAG: DNRLRE domain-containing protein [Bradymonadia bacterium]